MAGTEGQVPVRYLKDDPAVVEIQAGHQLNRLWWRVLLAMAGLFGEGCGCRKIWSRDSDMLWLDKQRDTLRVAVRFVAKTGTTVNGVEQHHLLWVETDGSRKWPLMNDPKRFRDFQEGPEIEILKDPSGKRPSL